MEKRGSGDKVECTLVQKASICRLRANPEEGRLGGLVPPSSVLAPGSALGSCRHGALSSPRAIAHRSAAERRRQGSLWEQIADRFASRAFFRLSLATASLR